MSVSGDNYADANTVTGNIAPASPTPGGNYLLVVKVGNCGGEYHEGRDKYLKV